MKSYNRFIFLFSVGCFLSGVLLCGCATTFTFAPGGKKYDNGYVVKRNDVIVPEFTVDKLGKAPADLNVAKARFKRRKKTIIHFYQEMGYFGSTITEDAGLFLSAFTVPVRTPIEGVKYNKYKNDPAYRAKIGAQDLEEGKKEQEKLKAIEDKMHEYIEKDIALENSKNKEESK